MTSSLLAHLSLSLYLSLLSISLLLSCLFPLSPLISHPIYLLSSFALSSSPLSTLNPFLPYPLSLLSSLSLFPVPSPPSVSSGGRPDGADGSDVGGQSRSHGDGARVAQLWSGRERAGPRWLHRAHVCL